MRSRVQRRSYGSVTVFWLDRDGALRAVQEGAERLGLARPEVLYVGLFGSLADGRAVPGSDADVIVLVSESARRPLDRPLDYLPYFDDVGLGVDLFIYTPEESERIPLARSALARARPLWQRS